MRETAVHLHDFTAGQSHRRMPEPRATFLHDAIVRDRADAEQDVVGQVLPRRDDRVVAEKIVLPQAGPREDHGAPVNLRAAQVDAVGKKSVGADLEVFGHDIHNGADLATTPDFHPGEAQPRRPKQRAAQPIAGPLDQTDFQPRPKVGVAPAARGALGHAAERPDRHRFGHEAQRQRRQHRRQHEEYRERVGSRRECKLGHVVCFYAQGVEGDSGQHRDGHGDAQIDAHSQPAEPEGITPRRQHSGVSGQR